MAPRRATRTTGWRTLLPPVDVDGPRVRLGVAWAVALLGAAAAHAVALAALLAVLALVASAQVARSWRGMPGRPLRAAAVVGAALPPLAAVWGVAPACAAAAAVAAGAALVARPAAGRGVSAARTAIVSAGIGLVAASPVVVLVERGTTPVLVLLVLACAYDAGAYLIGSGARSAIEGPIAGIAAVASLTLGVAALFVPPFRGQSPWVVGGLIGVLAPLGPIAASALLGDRTSAVPALRRLDVLLLAGPATAVATLILLAPPVR